MCVQHRAKAIIYYLLLIQEVFDEGFEQVDILESFKTVVAVVAVTNHRLVRLRQRHDVVQHNGQQRRPVYRLTDVQLAASDQNVKHT